MTQIIPAILATSEESYKEQIDTINSVAHDLDGWVHIDFMDDIFVQNKSIDLSVITKYPTELKKEAHLMVKNPTTMIWGLIQSGFERIIVHAESEDVTSNIKLIEENGLKSNGSLIEAGIALKLETPLTSTELLMDNIDALLFLSIRPGFQEQEFNPEVLEKIKAAKKLNIAIEVDGGITPENARMIVDAGVDRLVIGSHLLNGDVKQNLEKFKKALQNS